MGEFELYRLFLRFFIEKFLFEFVEFFLRSSIHIIFTLNNEEEESLSQDVHSSLTCSTPFTSGM